ncbi:DEAD/DEAH box helicase [Vreelandella titanicae]|uniref:DEAD/DEAH box helicase n=1 Tax=Vreelandella titanicae TaxID=664683 RepID=UPI003D0393F2|tara:strand:- start:3410 stop:6442 length:3033 start_codon:yes stop_codon:yes gene_type:complete
MKNHLKDLFNSLMFGRQATGIDGEPLQTQVDSSGLLFFASPQTIAELKAGKGSPIALLQMVVLQMLLEQGDAESLPNGYLVSSRVAAALDDEQADLLNLPGRFTHGFVANVKGHTRNPGFRVQLFASIDGQEYPILIKGPYLYVGQSQPYRLNPAELSAFSALAVHSSLSPDETGEAANLRLIAQLQAARRSGMDLALGAFSNLDVVVPEGIGVVATRMPDGSLELCPSLGDGSTPDQLDKRWTQLDLTRDGGVLRVEERLVLLEPEKIAAVREVLGSRLIPANKVEEFIKTPSAFLDASLINLDMGFSVRVLGIGKMLHVDFGPLDDKKRDWFATSSRPQPPEALHKHVTCTEDLYAFKERLHAAQQQGAQSVEFEGEQFDISEPANVASVLRNIEADLQHKPVKQEQEGNDQLATERVTLLLKDVDELNRELLTKAQQQDRAPGVDASKLLRSPYPHQAEGISWMLDLLLKALADDHENMYRLQGALLADDMGLGKTFMTLVMVAEYLAIQTAAGKTQKPILVVAPLSLLENWEDEISKTFKTSPFRDVKVLQAGRDLSEFRIKGAQRESLQLADLLDESDAMSEADIRYSLQIGWEAGTQRLDMGGRVVLTTYQTLRDYQFSLCVIDWGVVIFDEAQNIKNPNTLQTRAAKGLKADFKLLATGTPVENSLGDFWCLMDTAQPGLLGNWAEFRSKWITPVTQATEETRDQMRIETGSSLREAVGPFMLRRIKEQQLEGLPNKYIRSGLLQSEAGNLHRAPELAVAMKGGQLQAYDGVLDSYRRQRVEEDMRGQALSALQQLRSISLHPRMGDTGLLRVTGAEAARNVIAESAKLSVVLEQLDRIKTKGEKVILFMVTKQLQIALKMWLSQIYGLDIHIINGDTAAVQKKRDVLTRKKMIEQFESIAGFNIIIMSPIAAGVGLTVVGANHVIHVERHWNPAKEAQATDRVYRIGQTKDVYVHLPAALHPQFDSFDVHLDRLLSGKLMIKDAVVTPEPVDEKSMVTSMGL